MRQLLSSLPHSTGHKTRPRWLLLGIVAAWLVCAVGFQTWRRGEVIRFDVSSYYSYLPAVFIHQDLRFTYLDPQNRFNIWYETLPDGRRFQRMTMGLAFLYLPFFLMSHWVASIGGYPADGYSMPYEAGLALAGWFYASLGLWLLYRCLRRFFDVAVSMTTIVCIALGTNLLYYVSMAGAYSHSFTFCMASGFLWLFLKWRDAPSYRVALQLGLCAGLILLIRPTNALMLLLPAMYGLTWNARRTWADFHVAHVRHYALAAGAALLVLLPQLAYWKYATGHWVYYSYAGERFYFDNPHIIKGLFGFRKGWLVYTPIMALALLGLGMLKSKLAPFQLLLPIYLCLMVYITFSWWIWWYGGGFGQRAMIDAYPLLALPMAAFWERAWASRNWLKPVLLMAAMLVLLNGFQTLQMRLGILHWDSMTGAAYWKCFLKWERPADLDQLLVHPDLGKAYYGQEEG